MKNSPRVRVFLLELGFFMLLTFWAMSRTADARSMDQTIWEWRRIVVWTTLGVIAGPMTGAIAREGQSCCLENSISLLPVSGAILAGGVLLSFVPLPLGAQIRWPRILAWGLAWFGWFASGILSLLHALE